MGKERKCRRGKCRREIEKEREREDNERENYSVRDAVYEIKRVHLHLVGKSEKEQILTVTNYISKFSGLFPKFTLKKRKL